MRVNRYIAAITIAANAASQGRARYLALADALAQGILSGRIEAGSKMPPLRVLADELSVTVGTVNRVYTELERLGLVASRVGDGTYVVPPGQRVNTGEFENAPGGTAGVIDLSRNAHIGGEDADLLGSALARLGENPRRLAQLSEYLPDTGLARHREAAAQWLGYSGLDVSAEQVVITNGAQHALLCTLMATLRKDDLLVCEHLTYPGLVAATRALGVRLAGLPMDAQGLIPEALEETCAQQRVSALYCVPTIHNPTTGTMGISRRQAVADICLRYNVRIIEDDAHGVLVEQHPPSHAQFAPAHTMVISSLSKAVSSGLRVGFVAAPRPLVGRIASALRTSCWMATPLAAEIGAAWILDGTAAALRERQRLEIHRRKALLLSALSGIEARSAEDACHYWITLPEPWRASDLAAVLEERGVLVKPAEAFAVGRGGVPQCIRASVSGVDEAELLQGFRLLVDTVREDPVVHSADRISHQTAPASGAQRM